MINLLEIKNKFFISDSEIYLKDNNTLIIEKYLWDYEKAHEFQLYCVERVLENPKLIFLIITSHPNILTMGRGLQKLKNSDVELIEFDPSLKSELKLDLIDIKRGGGLTFHHSGQFIFYPIMKSTEYNLKVHDLMLDILAIAKLSLEKILHIEKLNVNKELLGLWYNNQKKIASIGLAVNRFVTYHGLALNFFENQEMKNEIIKLYPCGLPGHLYTSIEELVKMHETLALSQNSYQDFKNFFLDLFYEMIDKHKSSSPTTEFISAEVIEENLLESNSNIESSLS